MYKIYGHAGVIKRLARAVNSKQTDRSWIFCGISGIGKSIIAYRFAAYILAESETTNLDPDNIPEVFKMVSGRTHPDFFVMGEDASIEDYRNIASKLYRKPTLSNHRVFLIHDAEKLNLNTFNALLKLFEEPPQNTAIIMITNNLDVIPITLKSRCACVKFSQLSQQDIKMAFAGLGENISDAEIALANGSVGDALKLKGDPIYEKYLQAVTKHEINAFLEEYNVNDDWWKIRKCISRHLTAILNMSLELYNDTFDIEQVSIRKCAPEVVANTSHEILEMMSLTDSMQLDKTEFLRWCFDKLEHEIR